MTRSIAVLVLFACGDRLDEDGGTLTACPSTNVIEESPQFQWTFHPASGTNPTPYYSETLERGEATFTIGGSSYTTRVYRQAGGQYTIPGPTITSAEGCGAYGGVAALDRCATHGVDDADCAAPATCSAGACR